ncbi:MAG: hypothetical protein QF410_09665 [Planctomycetota bacterium]|nr:hypothetical protein [Planctomycetota bacterium]MDP6539797.1 hypothetical protein [Planctomycetota bacterium]
MWFEDLLGFAEADADADAVRARLRVDGERLTSLANGRSLWCGRLETPPLADLRRRAAAIGGGAAGARRGAASSCEEVVADVRELLADPANAGALFQVASQFNLLEMPNPDVTPEAGVDAYERDPTQGPACAVACGAGTIYRHYLAPIAGGVGQSAGRQIDCLADIGAALGNHDGTLWTMRNGYALLTERGLADLGGRLGAACEEELDALRGALRVGVQSGVEVTAGGVGHRLTQVFASALPVAYGGGDPERWAPFARLVLEAAYEATLLAARLNAATTGNPRAFLTLLGGGVFGNEEAWILAACERALDRGAAAGLEVRIVSFGRSHPAVRRLADRVAASCGEREPPRA